MKTKVTDKWGVDSFEKIGNPYIEFVNLESVGSIIKLETETIYPLQTNGKPDLNMGVLLDELDDEWFASLSDYDFGTISNLINNR